MNWERVNASGIALDDHRRELVMVEEVLRQRLEFWDEVRRMFGLRDQLNQDRYLYRAPSGGLYDIVFIGRTDEPFPSGMEFWYLAEGFSELPPKSTIDGDLWALTRDLVEMVETRHPAAVSVKVFESILPKPA